MSTTFGVVGTGWRGRYFLRLAQAVPERLRATGVVTRSAARAAEISTGSGVPAFTSIAELLRHERPEYVIMTVPRQVATVALDELVAAGVPVLTETPPADDVPGLREVWRKFGGSGLVQVAEQYPRLPAQLALQAVLTDGVIGKATSVQLSLTHLHHAAAVIRRLLGVGSEPARIDARQFVAPLHDPLTRAGWTPDPIEDRPATTTLATIDFDGRMGLYDFTDNQSRNPLRTHRITIRGTRGEIVDDRVVRLAEARTVVRSTLARERSGLETVLTGVDLRHITFDGTVLYRNPFAGTGLADEEVAVADLAEAMGAWVRGSGPPPYPLADGCQDHLIGLAIEEAARTGRTVTTTREPWAIG